MSGAPPRPLHNVCKKFFRHLLIGLLPPANRLPLILLVQTASSLLDFASSLARPPSLAPPPPHCGRCGRRRATSARCHPGRAQGRQGTRTAAPDSWAGSTGTGHPPQPRRSSGRRWMAVGLGGTAAPSVTSSAKPITWKSQASMPVRQAHGQWDPKTKIAYHHHRRDQGFWIGVFDWVNKTGRPAGGSRKRTELPRLPKERRRS